MLQYAPLHPGGVISVGLARTRGRPGSGILMDSRPSLSRTVRACTHPAPCGLVLLLIFGFAGFSPRDFYAPPAPPSARDLVRAGPRPAAVQQTSFWVSDGTPGKGPAEAPLRPAVLGGPVAQGADLPRPTDLPPPPPPLPLADALRETLEADPKIRAASEEINQASADLRTASLLPNPTLSVSGTSLPITASDKQSNPREIDVFVGFPIDWLVFGKRAAAIQSARAGVDVAFATFADLVRQRLVGTAAAFYDVLEAKALLETAREDLESLRRVEAITKERFKLKGVAEIEVDRIRLAVLDSEREVRRREAALVTATATLLAQLGRKQ